MILRVSFRTKIFLTMTGILLVFGVCLALIVSQMASEALLEESKERGMSVALNAAARVGEPLLARDFLRMKDLVDEVIRTSADIAYAFVQGDQGKPLVHSFTGGFPVELAQANHVRDTATYHVQLVSNGKELINDFAVPVVIGKNRLGTVRLGVSRKKTAEAVNSLVWAILATAGLAIASAALVGALFARTVTKRIGLLRKSAQEIVNGNLDIQTLPGPRLQCWQVMGCERRECPAYGNLRRRCWYVAGTLCPACVEGEYAKKVDGCRRCAVYRMNRGDEIQSLAEYFDLMAITLRRRMEDLRDLQERMVQSQKLESLGQLAAGVAHELNTPLGIILGYTQLLLRDFHPESETHETLQIMEKHSRICKRIVADLLRFSRTAEMHKKPLNLNEVMEQVLNVVEHSLKLDMIILERHFAPDLPLVLGDQERLQQVFLNLIRNACDAISSDGTIILTTRHDAQKQEVLVCVEDTGPGIPMDVRHRIFDPFFTTKPVGKGTGLGLSVSFGIVKDHGGHIELEIPVLSGTDDGNCLDTDRPRRRGTVFAVRFPVHQPNRSGSI